MKVRHVEFVEKVTFTRQCDFCKTGTEAFDCSICGADICRGCSVSLSMGGGISYTVCPRCDARKDRFLPVWLAATRALAVTEHQVYFQWKAASLGIRPDRMSPQRLVALEALVTGKTATDTEQEEYYNLLSDYQRHPLPE